MVRRTLLLGLAVVAVSLSTGCHNFRPFQWRCGGGCWPNTYTPAGGGPLLQEPLLNRPIFNRPLLGAGAPITGQPVAGPMMSGPMYGGDPNCTTCGSVGGPMMPYGHAIPTTFGVPTTLGQPTVIQVPGGTPAPMPQGGATGGAGGAGGTTGGMK